MEQTQKDEVSCKRLYIWLYIYDTVLTTVYLLTHDELSEYVEQACEYLVDQSVLSLVSVSKYR